MTHSARCIAPRRTSLTDSSECLTVSGRIPTKKLLYPLFGLPLAFHLFVEDVKNYVIPGAPLHAWLPEISVLMIMASLLCISVALEPRKI